MMNTSSLGPAAVIICWGMQPRESIRTVGLSVRTPPESRRESERERMGSILTIGAPRLYKYMAGIQSLSTLRFSSSSQSMSESSPYTAMDYIEQFSWFQHVLWLLRHSIIIRWTILQTCRDTSFLLCSHEYDDILNGSETYFCYFRHGEITEKRSRWICIWTMRVDHVLSLIYWHSPSSFKMSISLSR